MQVPCVTQPVAGTCQSAIFTLMTVALEAFDESSLGNCEVCISYITMTTITCGCIQVLSSVAAMVMTHPRLRAEFWNTVSTNTSNDYNNCVTDRVLQVALVTCYYLTNQS